MESIETVVIGGGQAGLAMSYHLAQLGREHTILERARIAERWRSERWDSLSFQFPNWMMNLPGYAYEGSELDHFMHRDGVVRFIEEYARRIAPPIRCGVRATALDLAETGRLLVKTDQFALEADNVVLATGPYQQPSIPVFSAALPSKTYQVTANRYTKPEDLPAGSVLVVGSGGSGCQIAEDLLQSGRGVYLSVSRHRRVPRRYRGKDVAWWWEKTGAFDQTEFPKGDTMTGDSAPLDARAPLLTGANGGQDVDLRLLASRGMVLVGSLQDIQGVRLSFASDLERNLARGDESFDQFTRSADEYILKHGLAGPQFAKGDLPPAVRRSATTEVRELDIRAAQVNSVIWATGYRYDFGWVNCPVLDASARPVHKRGVTAVPGVYFLGLPRLHTVRSSILWGVGADAAYLAQHIATRN